MAKLPAHVIEVLDYSAKDRVDEADDGLVKRVIKGIVSLLARSAESEPDEVANENAEQHESDASCSEGVSDAPAYGYPPAYGVPAHVAVRLLTDALAVLTKVLDAIDDESLSEQVKALLEKIQEALGVNTAKSSIAAQTDIVSELQLAVSVSQGTQPVLSPAEASERLRVAWERFVTTVKLGYAAEQGQIFEATFALRAAVEAAKRTLMSLVVNSEQRETEEEQEVTAQERQENGVDASNQQEEPSVAETDIVAEATAGNSPTESEVIAEVSTQEAQPQGNDASLTEVVMQLVAQVAEVAKRLEQLESQVVNRKRVTLFAASKEQRNSEDDLLQRWYSAKTEAERRAVLRAAQRMLAAPILLEED